MKAKKFFYLMLVSLFISFGAIIAAFYWGDSHLGNKAAEISDLQAERDVLQDKKIKLKAVVESVEKVPEAEMLVDSLLPKDKEQEKLLADVIYTATAEADIPISKITTISFSGSSEPGDLSGTEQLKDIPGVYTYPFTITIENISYETLLLLLQEIETNGRLVQIDDLQINPSRVVAGELASVNLSMKAFLNP